MWRPVYEGGETVRFFNGVDELVPLDPDWAAPRYAYVQHASDPVGAWNIDQIWTPAPWTDDPRGPDVPEGGPWVPFVTGIQGVFDLMAGFSAPPGHGHDYMLEWPGDVGAGGSSGGLDGGGHLGAERVRSRNNVRRRRPNRQSTSGG